MKMKKFTALIAVAVVTGFAFGPAVRATDSSPPGKSLVISASPASSIECYKIGITAFAQPALTPYVFYESASPPGYPDTTKMYSMKIFGENATPASTIGITPTSTGPPRGNIVYIIEAKGQAMAFLPGNYDTGANTTAAINFGRGGQTVS